MCTMPLLSTAPLPMVDTVLHKTYMIEAREASYLNEVFINYLCNLRTNTITLSTIRTAHASLGKGLAKGALQWLCNLADSKGLSIELIAQPLSNSESGLTSEQLVRLYSKFGFKVKSPVAGKYAPHPLMTREASPPTFESTP